MTRQQQQISGKTLLAVTTAIARCNPFLAWGDITTWAVEMNSIVVNGREEITAFAINDGERGNRLLFRKSHVAYQDAKFWAVRADSPNSENTLLVA